ncbi:MAG: hypothetical protein AMXMBFR84_48360 [Candidatus Hydrogenedentota bacterium]
MGDACNMADIERFMRSKAGKKHLREIRKMLKGHTVVDVSFSNEVWSIATTLHLDDGECFVVFQPSLEVDALREEFADAIEVEYYKDFPERRPKEET